MRALIASVLDWIEDRTGIRTLQRHLLEEPLPPGTGWFFTLGALLLLLLGVQVATGVVLMLYYVPAPDHAWDSLRFITERVTFGRIVRNLHAFGASFIVVAAALHLLRVFFFGSYKRPREATWVTGVALLLVIMGLALTGYLLPWDQRAYWATVVTLNIARTAPLAGELAAGLMRGGPELGALTLSRWYAVHVVVLPLALLALAAAHLTLMRRHRISGPIRPRAGEPKAFFPYHAARDVTIGALVFAALLALATLRDAPLDPVADPSDASYVPRPEWYFLWLFQMLKYFPGRLEVIGAHGVPALLVALLILLPFLDRSPERRPWRRPLATAAAVLIVAAIGTLTVLGLRDVPAADVETRVWGAQALGGRLIASQPTCTRCHRTGGDAPEWTRLRAAHDDGWLKAHVYAPDRLVPELPADADAILRQRSDAVAAWARALRRGTPPPDLDAHDERALATIGANCLGCHVLDGDGHGDAPNLSRAGKERDAKWLAGWITNPLAYEYDTDMPAFGDRLPPEDIRRVAEYLAQRK
jgi:ubiquinol-cytochrome c reductase cytochrome b subunit